MSVSTIRDVANIQYSGLYIPVASWFYIYHQTESRLAFYAIPITLLGATIAHGIFVSIFGHEGPRIHPKKDLAVVGYSLGLMYTKSPGGTPDTMDEFYQRLYDAFTVRRGIRFTAMLTISILFVVFSLYSLIPLYKISANGGDLLAGVLLLTQLIFIIQGVMMNRFASVLPPEEAEWVWVPEYRRVKEFYTEEEYPVSEYRDPPLIFEDFHEWMKELREEFLIAQNIEAEDR